MIFDFDQYNILTSLIFSTVIQAVFFSFAAGFKTDKVTDFSYSLSFIAMTVVLQVFNRAFSIGQVVAAAFIVVWSLRLGSYLFIRILKIGKDDRFDERRGNFLKFLRFWILQALIVWLVMLPAECLLVLALKFPHRWYSERLFPKPLYPRSSCLETSDSPYGTPSHVPLVRSRTCRIRESADRTAR